MVSLYKTAAADGQHRTWAEACRAAKIIVSFCRVPGETSSNLKTVGWNSPWPCMGASGVGSSASGSVTRSQPYLLNLVGAQIFVELKEPVLELLILACSWHLHGGRQPRGRHQQHNC